MRTFNFALRLWVVRPTSNSSNFIPLANIFYTPMKFQALVTLKTIRWSIPFIYLFEFPCYISTWLCGQWYEPEITTEYIHDRENVPVTLPSKLNWLLAQVNQIDLVLRLYVVCSNRLWSSFVCQCCIVDTVSNVTWGDLSYLSLISRLDFVGSL